MDIQMLLALIAIVSPIVLSFIWAVSLTSKISNRALLLEVSSKNHETRIVKIEEATSHASMETLVGKLCVQVFHSKEFKDTLKESVRDTMLHIEANRTAAAVGSYDEILSGINQLHKDLINKK